MSSVFFKRTPPQNAHTQYCVLVRRFRPPGGGRNAISVGVGAIALSYNIFAYSNVRSAFGLTKCRLTCYNFTFVPLH